MLKVFSVILPELGNGLLYFFKLRGWLDYCYLSLVKL